jgi:hypothetical protein
MSCLEWCLDELKYLLLNDSHYCSGSHQSVVQLTLLDLDFLIEAFLIVTTRFKPLCFSLLQRHDFATWLLLSLLFASSTIVS